MRVLCAPGGRGGGRATRRRTIFLPSNIVAVTIRTRRKIVLSGFSLLAVYQFLFHAAGPLHPKSIAIANLEVVDKLLLLLEDVLELSKGGLHLLQGELVLALSRLVLGNPGVEFSDSVVKENPFLDQDFTLLDPGLRDSLDLVKSFFECFNLIVSLSVGGHLEGSSLSSLENLQIVDTGLVKGVNLVIKSLDFIKI